MTERNQPAAIKFSLEETVWFRKGAEIEDLISLSLEPDVTIQDLEQFVSILGALKMSGEYIKSGQTEQEENQNYQVSGQKYVTIFDERDDGISKFQYEFPVDITIPKSRIVNFDDLDMVIDTFDYTMNEPNGLTLMTEVLISGVESENADVYDRNDLIEESNPNEE